MKLEKSLEEYLLKLSEENEKKRKWNYEEIRRYLESDKEMEARKKDDLIGYGCSCAFLFLAFVVVVCLVVFR